MIGRKALVGLALLCVLPCYAFVAQGAIAAGKGQTTYTCAEVQVDGEFSDAHCDDPLVGGKYAHLAFTQTTAITVTNAATENETKSAARAHLFVSELHGVKEVEVNCTTVSGTGEASNSETGGLMKASGSGTINFTGCTANHACTVSISETPVKGETVEGLASEGMGLKLEPKTGTVFTKITFTGTSCPLKAFGAIPIEGSTIGTAHGEPKGEGATVYFGEMNSLTIGGQSPEFTARCTDKGPNGNALLRTTA
jgi:hypothetical protein